MGKKTKKNPGKKGGKREDPVKAEIQVNGDTIDLVKLKKAGVEINVLSNKENLAGNNNEDCDKKEFCISNNTVEELSAEVDDKATLLKRRMSRWKRRMRAASRMLTPRCWRSPARAPPT